MRSDDPRPGAGAAGRAGVRCFMGVLLRGAVGSGRPDLRAGCALPGHVAGLCDLMTRGLVPVLLGAPASAVLWAYSFGVLWGVGGLTFGLAVRYLGMSLGYALVLGNCAVFGTLVPPIFHGQFVQLLSQRSGIITLAGLGVCALGIVLAGAAGVSKEKELSAEQKEASVQEFNLKLGLAVAVFAGVMSACFVFGLDAGNPIKALTVAYGTSNLWQGLPVLVVVLGGGFT